MSQTETTHLFISDIEIGDTGTLSKVCAGAMATPAASPLWAGIISFCTTQWIQQLDLLTPNNFVGASVWIFIGPSSVDFCIFKCTFQSNGCTFFILELSTGRRFSSTLTPGGSKTPLNAFSYVLFCRTPVSHVYNLRWGVGVGRAMGENVL